MNPALATGKPELIDDETASTYWNTLDSAPDPERNRMLAALDLYADRKIEEEQAGRFQHFERVYSDFDNWWKETSRPTDQDFDDEAKARIANRGFIAEQFGRPAEQMRATYPFYRDQFTEREYGKKGLSERETFKLIQGGFQTRRELETAVNEIPGDVMLRLFESLGTGKPVDVPGAVSAWKERNAGTLANAPRSWEGTVLENASRYVSETEAALREHAQTFKSLYDHMSRATGRAAQGAGLDDPQTAEDFRGFVDTLASLPPDVRDRGYASIVLAAKQAGIETKDFWQQWGESWGRNINLVRSGALNAQELDAEARLKLLENKDVPRIFIDEASGELTATAVDKSGLREVTPEERKALASEAARNFARFEIYRELRDLADSRWDPIKKLGTGWAGFGEAAAYGSAQSAGYTAMAMIPIAGPYLTAAAMTSDTYDRLRVEHREMPASEAKIIAGISGPVQSIFEVIPARALFGKLPALEGVLRTWVNPAKTGALKRIGARIAVVGAGEQVTEGLQDLTTPFIQDIASALREDVPGVDWEEEFKEWRGSRLDTFAATLPLILLGSGGVVMAENSRMRKFEHREQVWKITGFSDEQIARIEEGETLAEKQEIARTELKTRTPDNIAAGVKMASELDDQARAAQADPEAPTLTTRRMTDESGQEVEQYEILKPDGTTAYVTGDFDAAVSAYAQARGSNQANAQASVRELVDFYEEKARREGRGEDVDAWVIENAPKTAQDALDRGEADIEQLAERIALAGQEAGTSPADVRIFGESIAEIQEGVFRGVRKFYEGAHPDTVIEEEAETFIKRAISEERVSMDWLRSQVQEASSALGRDLQADSDQAVIESLSDLAVDYAHGRIGDDRLPSSVRAFLRQVMTLVREMMERAIGLKRAFSEGKLSSDLETFLADSVGLPLEGRVSEATASVQGKTLAPGITFSMGERRLEIVRAQATDPTSAKAALAWWEASGPREARLPSGRTVSVSKGAIKKATSEKAFPQARMAMIPHLQDLLNNGHEVIRPDDGRDKNVAEVSEVFAPFEHEGTVYRARILSKIFTSESNLSDKLHSARIEDVILEKADARLEKPADDVGPLPSVRAAASPGASVTLRQLLPKSTFSVSSGEYQKTVLSAIAKMEGAPEARFDVAQRIRSRYTAAREKHRAVINALKDAGHAAKESERDGLIQAAHNRRDSALADIDRNEAEQSASAVTAQERNRIRFASQSARRRARNAFASEISKVMGKDLDREGLVQALGEFESILSVLPSEVRGKIGGFRRMAEFKTERGWARYLAGRIDKIDAAFEQYLLRETRARIERLLERNQPKKGENRIQKSGIGPDAQAIVNAATKAAQLDGAETEAELARISELIRVESGKDERDQKDAKRISELLQEWSIFNAFGDLANRDSSHLADTYDWLRSVIDGGRTSWRIQEEARIEEVRKLTDYVERTLGKADLPGLAEAANISDKALAKIDAFMVEQFTFEQVLKDVLGLDENNVIVRRMSDSVRRAATAYEMEVIKGSREFNAALLRALGEAPGGRAGMPSIGQFWRINDALKRMVERHAEKVQIWPGQGTTTTRIPIHIAQEALAGGATAHNFNLADLQAMREALDALPGDSRKKFIEVEQFRKGKPAHLPMTKDDAIQFLLSWDQADVRENMERDGFTEESISQMRELTKDPVSRAMTEFYRATYPAGYDSNNSVYRRIFGMAMPRNSNYAPARYRHGGKEAAEISPYGEAVNEAGITSGHVKLRVKHNAMIRQVGAAEVYWGHLAQSAYWRSHAEVIRDVRSVLLNPKVMLAIEQKAGADKARFVRNWVDTLTVGGSRKTAGLSLAGRAIRRISSGHALAVMGSSIRNVLIQSDALFRFLLKVPAKDLPGIMHRLFSGELMQSIHKSWNSPTVQTRLISGTNPAMKMIFEQSKTSPSQLAFLASQGMVPMQYFDAALTSVSAAIVYDHAHRQSVETLGEKAAQTWALDEMDRAVHETGFPTTLANRSLMEIHGGPIFRWFFMYRTDLRQKAALEYEAWKGIANKRGDVGDHIRTLVVMRLYALLGQFLMDAVKWMLPGDEDEEIFKWENYTRALALGHINGIFLVGDALSYGYSFLARTASTALDDWGLETAADVIGRPRNFSSTQNLLEGFVRDAQAWTETEKLFNSEDPEEMLKTWRRATRSLAIVGPAGTLPTQSLGVVSDVRKLGRRLTGSESEE